MAKDQVGDAETVPSGAVGSASDEQGSTDATPGVDPGTQVRETLQGGSHERPSLSVVIPALNEERHVGSLLSGVLDQRGASDEVIVVDAGSEDGTVPVVEGFPGVVLLNGSPPVAVGRNLGGRRAVGDVLIFLDADVRLPEGFFEGFLREFEERRLDVACPEYIPYRSTPQIRAIFGFFNLLFKATERLMPSGAGHCIAVRGEAFRESEGFDPKLKFDDIELIRRLSRGRRFGIVGQRVYVSDRRYREHGVGNMLLRYMLLSLFFALGQYRWANRIDYEFGRHDQRER